MTNAQKLAMMRMIKNLEIDIFTQTGNEVNVFFYDNGKHTYRLMDEIPPDLGSDLN